MTDPMLREVSLCAPGKAVEPRGIALSMGAAKEHEGDELDVPELDELPPSVHEDGPRDPLARERVEGPRGEPDDLHAGDWDDELPNDRSGFDASVASDLPLEAFLGIDDDRGLEHGDTRGFGDDDAAGSDDLGLFEALAHAEVDEPLAVDDLGIDEDLRTPVDDGGAEGTSEDIAAEVNEEDLPELDQDDGGAFELDDLMRELRAGGLGHEGDGDGWVLYDGWGARVPCFAIAIDGGRVLAAGDELLFVEPGTHLARTASLPRRATAIAASPDGAVVGTARGVLLAPALGRPGSLGALAPTMSLLDSDLPVRAIAVFAGRTWALVGGELWLVGSPPAPPILARSGVLAMATARDSLVVLSGSTERLLERFRGDDGDWEPIPLPPEARAMLALSEASTISVCAEGQTLALSGPTGVFVSRDAGARVAAIELEHVVAIAFGGPRADPTLFAATWVADELLIVSVDRRNRTRVEGRLHVGSLSDPSSDDPEPRLTMSWDETREALFLATPTGLYAVGPRRTH